MTSALRRLRTRVLATALVALTVAPGAVVLSAAPAQAATSSFVRTYDPVAGLASRAIIELRAVMQGADPLARRRFQAVRVRLAEEVGRRLFVEPDRLREAWRTSSRRHQLALYGAMSQLGVPYRSMALAPGEGFDCSGLTTYAWSVAGVSIPRSSGTQIAAAAPRTWATAQAGDLVHYPGHISMYVGVDLFVIHSPQPGESVEMKVQTRSSRLGDPTA